MAKKEKQLTIVGGKSGTVLSNSNLILEPGKSPGTGRANVVIYPKFTFEGTLCYKDGKPYGHIVEENESHIIVELRNENPNEYPQRHEFRKERKES